MQRLQSESSPQRQRCAALLCALLFAASDVGALTLPHTYHVGASATNCNFTSLDAALATAASGDTIVLDGGQTYASEHAVINNKSISIAAWPCQAVIGGVTNAITANAQVTVSGDTHATSAVFTISGSSVVTLTDLKITGNGNSNDGGGIEHTGTGTLTLNNVLVTATTARNGGGVDVSGTGNLVIGNDTQIIGNTASIAGGGIRFASTGTLTAAGTGNLIANNHAPNSFGGGLYVLGGSATITASGIGSQPLFYLNDAYSGGGIAVRSTATYPGSVELGDVGTAPIVIDNNSASRLGGGVYLESYDDNVSPTGAFFSALNAQLTRNSAFDGAAAYVDCPNGATSCTVPSSSFGFSTDGCSGIGCSLVQTNTATSPNGSVFTIKNAAASFGNARMTGNSGAYLLAASSGATVQLQETLITGNSTTQALLSATTGALELAQCTLADNAVGATHLIGVQNATFELLNSVVDTDVSTLSQTGGAQTVHDVVATNIDGLPTANDVLLADPAFINPAQGDYRLRVTSDGVSFIVSPAVDFSAQGYDTADIDGRTRPADVAGATNRFGAYDLGVYEMQPITDRIFANGYGDVFLLAQ